MNEIVAAIAVWVACNVLYYAGAAILLLKNQGRTDIRIVGLGAILVGPLLILLPVAQLLFVVPLYIVFSIEGFILPRHLPLKTAAMTIGFTLLAFAIVTALAMWTEPN